MLEGNWEKLSWCLKKKKKSADLLSASNSLHHFNLGQVGGTAPPPKPLQSSSCPWLLFILILPAENKVRALGGRMGTTPGCTLGPDLNGKWVITLWNCSLGFPWPVQSFLNMYTFFFLSFFLITWFWIGQQTCLFAQLDLNWLLVQTSGGFSVWLCSSLSRKTSLPLFSIFCWQRASRLAVWIYIWMYYMAKKIK